MYQRILEEYPSLNVSILGNHLLDYAASLVIFIVLMIFFKILKSILLVQLKFMSKKTKWNLDDTVIKIVDAINPRFYAFLSLYISLKFLQINNVFDYVLDAILIIWLTYQVIHAVQVFVRTLANEYLAKEGREGETESTVQAVTILVNIGLWSLGILLILSNTGVDITSLIAGLGIGGVAIAFAVKDILSDLFSSFTIFFDKPFKVGDFVVSDPHVGTVQKIGLKTTRIKSLSGEEVVVPNQVLTSQALKNYNPMEERRIEFGFGITYDTPIKKVKQIPTWIEEIITKLPETDFQRAHFKKFGDSDLQFVVVYKLMSSEYNLYMDTQQAINLAMMEKFAKEKVEFAYPTQTIYTQKA